MAITAVCRMSQLRTLAQPMIADSSGAGAQAVDLPADGRHGEQRAGRRSLPNKQLTEAARSVENSMSIRTSCRARAAEVSRRRQSELQTKTPRDETRQIQQARDTR